MIAHPIISSSLTQEECKVFDVALAGIYGGDIERIQEMDADTFDKLHQYITSLKEIKSCYNEIVNYQMNREMNKNKHR